MKKMLIALYYPDSVSADEIRRYAKDALEHWGGQRHPDDHLFSTTKAPKKEMQLIEGAKTGGINSPTPNFDELA